MTEADYLRSVRTLTQKEADDRARARALADASPTEVYESRTHHAEFGEAER